MVTLSVALLVIDPRGGQFCQPLIDDARKRGFEVVLQDRWRGCQPDDIVHVDWCDEHAAAACDPFDAPKKRLTIRLHRYELKTGWPGKVLWENVDRLIFVSGYQRGLFARLHPDAKPREVVVAPAIEHIRDLPFVERRGLGDIALASRVSPEKGIALAVQIARKCPERRFEWFGKSECLYSDEYLRQRAPSNLVMRGFMARDELVRELSDPRFTHLLHCSTSEGFAVAVAEAMALGLIPVVHAHAGVKELALQAEIFWTDIDEAAEKLRHHLDGEGGRWSDVIRARAGWRLSEIVLAGIDPPAPNEPRRARSCCGR